MRCSRCNRSMTEGKRSFHKQRKWRCLGCGRVRFQRNRPRYRYARRRRWD